MRASLRDPCRQLSDRVSTVVATENETVALQQTIGSPFLLPLLPLQRWQTGKVPPRETTEPRLSILRCSTSQHPAICLHAFLRWMMLSALLCSLRCLLVLFRVPPLRQYKWLWTDRDGKNHSDSPSFFRKSSRVPWWIFSFGLGDGDWGPSPWTSPKL